MLSRRSWTPAAALVAAAGAAWLLASYVPPLKPLRPADVLIVLGHPAGADGRPSQAMHEEVALAVRLYQAGLARHAIFSGGAVHNQHVEARVMARLAGDLGLPAEAIHCEAQARDTLENAAHCRQLMAQQRWTRAIVVTIPYHARRAGAIFRRAGIPHQLAYDANSYQFTSPILRALALGYELIGQAGYLWSAVLGLPAFWRS